MAAGLLVDVVMPQMGVSVTEGTVTRWLRSVGDAVNADDTLLEISTDKVDTELPSPVSGVVSEILVLEGQTVVVGTVLARIDPAREATGETNAVPATPELPGAGDDAGRQPQPGPPPVADNGAATEAHVFISPVVARIAAERGVDLADVRGSGAGGRITKKDLFAYLEEPELSEEESPRHPLDDLEPDDLAGPPLEPPGSTSQSPAPSPTRAETAPGERLEPLSAMRRGIAEHMRRSLDTAAHVTSVIEVDISTVVAIRRQIEESYLSAYDVRPSYLAFVARAAVDTLRDWPWVNAELRPDGILTHSHVNLGIAVSLDGGRGLIVPVIKHAEGLNLVGMTRGIADVAERARGKRLLPDDVQGGTFTITNPGGYGTLLGTPVISQPQSAILGVYTITRRPWVIADDADSEAIAIRSIMNLTLTYDHRLIDGAYAAQYLRDVAGRLEHWDLADY